MPSVTPLNGGNVWVSNMSVNGIAGDGSGSFTVFFTNGTTAVDTLFTFVAAATP